MNVLLALLSLRWSFSLAFLVFWNGMFFLVARLNDACPSGNRLCSPLSRPILVGTLIATAFSFLALVWSNAVRRVVIAPKRQNLYDEGAFYAFALIALALAVSFLFFV